MAIWTRFVFSFPEFRCNSFSYRTVINNSCVGHILLNRMSTNAVNISGGILKVLTTRFLYVSRLIETFFTKIVTSHVEDVFLLLQQFNSFMTR